MADREDPLNALWWHWGTAYVICHPEPGIWIAQRRDDRTTLRATTPLGLRDRIVADYTARPVRREAARPAPRDNPDADCPCLAPEL